MNKYTLELEFHATWNKSKEIKKSDIEFNWDEMEATIYDEKGKHWFCYKDGNWQYVGSKDW
jgi:hypothetical protein